MRIAIIIQSFCETTFSFAEAWGTAGDTVDIYYVSDKSQILKDPGFVTNQIDARIGECRELKTEDCRGASQMLRYPSVHLFFYRIPSNDISPKANPVKWCMGRMKSLWYVSRLKKILSRNHYDCHEIIFPSSQLTTLLFSLSPKNTFVSFHEIIKNKNKVNVEWCDIHNSLKIAIHKGFNVRFFSNAMKNGILAFAPESESLFHVVPFGLFTMYRDYENDETPNLVDIPKDYLLYFGYIFQYKGLDVLWDATERLKEKGISLPIVIAGNGGVPVLDKMKNSNQYTVINRFIENSEVIRLIKNCKAVVCPYIGGSQSGLPMTVYPFGKPIIATSIGDFPEVVPNNTTGIVVPPNDANALAEAISKVFKNGEFYDNLKDNINSFDEVCKNHSWTYIVNSYKSMLSKENDDREKIHRCSCDYIRTVINSLIFG